MLSLTAHAGAAVPVIVQISGLSSITSIAASLGATVLDGIPDSNIYLLNVPFSIPPSLATLLGIQWHETNSGITLPNIGQLGVFHVIAGTGPDWYKYQPTWQIMHSQDALAYSRGAGVIIADLNSQVDTTHPALAGHLTGGYDFVSGKPYGYGVLNQSSSGFMDQSSSGFMDQSSSGFMDQSSAGFMDNRVLPLASGNPAYSHGTLCAGVLAAIAPGSTIMPLRVFDDNGQTDLFTIAKAIRYAVQQGAQVVNMSFGTLTNSDAIRDSINYALAMNVTLTTSAGNNSTTSPQYPAAYNGVITTAATNIFDRKALFSNYGSSIVVDAPGVNLILPYPGGMYSVVSGTSFSAPAVAGTAALLRSLRVTGTIDSISGTAVNIDSVNPDYTGLLGSGRIDSLDAVKLVIPAVSTHTFNLGTSSGDDVTMVADINTVAVGYGTVQPANGNPTPAGIEVFSYRPNGVLISETAVPASHLRQTGRIYAESSGPVRTGIAIANPADQDAVISFYLTDSNGVNFGDGTTTIPAHHQLAAFLDQAPYGGNAAAQSFTFTSSVPVGAIALRVFVNERSEALLTTLPVAAVSSTPLPPGGSTILPHFAAGGGWSTQVLLVNPTDGPLSGIVEMDGTYPYTIAPRSSAKLITSNWKDLRTGNVRVTAAAGTALPVISTVFSLVTNGITVTQTGIATTGSAQSFELYVESDSARRLQTGIAIGNAGSGAASTRFDLLTLDGVSTGYSGSASTDPAGHIAMFLNQIPGLQSLPPSFRGILHISSDSMISAIGLRTIYNERGDFLFATTPAVAGNTPPSADAVVFPQVVSGSGFNTEIILMNSAGTSQGTVTLTSQSGIEMPLFVR
jgi:subtilisin family serine protease